MIEVNKNGEFKLFVAETGSVTSVNIFPCSTPGKKFMKTIIRKGEHGNIGAEGYKRLKSSGLNEYALYRLLNRYNRSDVVYDFRPGICRDEYGRKI